jgi:hypothetical protein
MRKLRMRVMRPFSSLKWWLVILCVKAVRKVSVAIIHIAEHINERSYYVVPAACQYCFDRRPAMNTCKACDFSSL